MSSFGHMDTHGRGAVPARRGIGSRCGRRSGSIVMETPATTPERRPNSGERPGERPGERRCPAGSGRRRRAAVRACLAILAAIGGAVCLAGGSDAQIRLPDFGDASEQVISPAEERALGEAFMREVRARLDVVEDPQVEQYIQSLGYRLVAASDRQGLGFTFFVIEDGSVNAFAGPGGFIGVHSGLILATRTESELASVLAHEIAHVTQRHIARTIEDADRTNLPVLAGVIAAILIGTRNVEAGQATAAAVIGSRVQRQINFTRQNELEADRVGIRLLAGAGFDPRDMAGFFEKLENASRYSQRPPEFLSTHPVTTDRIAEAQERAGRLPYRQHRNSDSYYLVRAKLRVRIASDPQRVLDRLVEERATGHAQSPAANAYGQALAMARLGREDDARATLERLLEAHPDNLAFRAELADLALRTGNPSRSLALYAEGLDLYPDDKVLVHGYAVALNDTGRPRDALELIDEYERLYVLDSRMRRLRAEAYEKLGRSIDSRAELAEHYYLSGQLERAIHQLRLASRAQDEDSYRAARVEARLEELETELAQRRRGRR